MRYKCHRNTGTGGTSLGAIVAIFVATIIYVIGSCFSLIFGIVTLVNLSQNDWILGETQIILIICTGSIMFICTIFLLISCLCPYGFNCEYSEK